MSFQRTKTISNKILRYYNGMDAAVWNIMKSTLGNHLESLDESPRSI